MNNILDVLRKNKRISVVDISKHTGIPMIRVADALKNIKDATGDDVKNILIFLTT